MTRIYQDNATDRHGNITGDHEDIRSDYEDMTGDEYKTRVLWEFKGWSRELNYVKRIYCMNF
jgi:hypothetical protein